MESVGCTAFYFPSFHRQTLNWLHRIAGDGDSKGHKDLALTATISDHMPNFLLIDNGISKIKPKPQFKRDYKNFDEIKYVSNVKSKNLLPRNSSENLNESFDHLSISKTEYFPQLTIMPH